VEAMPGDQTGVVLGITNATDDADDEE